MPGKMPGPQEAGKNSLSRVRFMVCPLTVGAGRLTARSGSPAARTGAAVARRCARHHPLLQCR
ncbi:hypothetical protein C4K04_4268 [Pseudomonas chlororaphis]|uniref:Uncharacterized protein n=1 Tax=Pseudomonas chlororaphis TaxID=587753 RepID=A0A3G7TU69_9PSED|nr:hypothetical protein C4K04_4268 [Pseudomonas chlororaphis]